MVRAQWYEATTSAASRRRSYKLLPDTVMVTVESIIQEQGLDFLFGGSVRGDNCLGDEAHARIMKHNFSNYI